MNDIILKEKDLNEITVESFKNIIDDMVVKIQSIVYDTSDEEATKKAYKDFIAMEKEYENSRKDFFRKFAELNSIAMSPGKELEKKKREAKITVDEFKSKADEKELNLLKGKLKKLINEKELKVIDIDKSISGNVKSDFINNLIKDYNTILAYDIILRNLTTEELRGFELEYVKNNIDSEALLRAPILNISYINDLLDEIESSKIKIGIIGFKGSGKTTLANELRERLGDDKTNVFSFAKPVKDIANQIASDLNIDVEAHDKETIRPIYVTLGNKIRDSHPNFWIERWNKEVEEAKEKFIICDDVRFVNELNEFDIVIKVTRKSELKGDDIGDALDKCTDFIEYDGNNIDEVLNSIKES